MTLQQKIIDLYKIQDVKTSSKEQILNLIDKIKSLSQYHYGTAETQIIRNEIQVLSFLVEKRFGKGG